jgi:hypothetical protein
MDKNPNHHKSKTSSANQRRRNLDEWANRYKTAIKATNTKKETNMSTKSNTSKGTNKQNASPEVKEEVIEEIQAPKDLPTEPKASEEDLEEIKKIYGNGKSEDEVEAAAKAAEAAAEKLRSTAKAALDEAQAKTKDAAEEEVVLEEKLKSTEDVLKEKYEVIQDGELVTKHYRVTHVVKSDIPLDTRTVNDFRNNPDKLLEENQEDTFDDPSAA